MMNLSTIDSATVRGVEAVALGEPVFNRPRFAPAHFAAGAVVSTKLGSATETAGAILNIPAQFPGRHCGVKIGQVVEAACGPDRRKTAGVETEEIHPRLAPID